MQAAAASAQQQMEQVALLPRMMAMAHVLAANDAQQRQTLWPPPAPHFADLPECAPLVMGGQQQQPQQQQQQQQQECADQLMALLAAGKAAEGVPLIRKSTVAHRTCVVHDCDDVVNTACRDEIHYLQATTLLKRATSARMLRRAKALSGPARSQAAC